MFNENRSSKICHSFGESCSGGATRKKVVSQSNDNQNSDNQSFAEKSLQKKATFQTTVTIPKAEILEEQAKSYQSEKIVKENIVTPQEIIQNIDNQKDKNISEVEIRRAWSLLTQIKRQEDKTQEIIILDKEIKYHKNTITVGLSGEMQIRFFNEYKNQWIIYLRNELKTNNLFLNSEILQPTEDKRMMYTNSDKLARLMEKNQFILSLRNVLGLDLES
jgi:hypothetical protein